MHGPIWITASCTRLIIFSFQDLSQDGQINEKMSKQSSIYGSIPPENFCCDIRRKMIWEGKFVHAQKKYTFNVSSFFPVPLIFFWSILSTRRWGKKLNSHAPLLFYYEQVNIVHFQHNVHWLADNRHQGI